MSAEGVAFIVAACGSLLLTLGLELVWNPDVRLYTEGVSLFPSPLGTVLGSVVGVEGLAVTQALCIGGVAGGLVVLRPPLLSVVTAAPFLVALAPLGVDVLAGVLFAFGYLRERHRWALWASAGLHVAGLLLVLVVSGWRVRLAAATTGAGLLLLTPYSAGLTPGAWDVLGGLGAGALVAGLLVLVAIAGRAPLSGRTLALLAGVGAAVAYGVAFDLSVGVSWGQSWPQTVRYGFPVLFVVLVTASQAYGRTERPTTAPGKGPNVRKRLGLVLGLLALGALFVVPAAFAQTVPAVPVGQYGDSLLTSLASAIGQIFPYAAAITAFAIAVGMVKRWLGHRKATRV